MAEEAVIYDNQNPQDHLHLAHLYYVMSNRLSVEKHCDTAMDLSKIKELMLLKS